MGRPKSKCHVGVEVAGHPGASPSSDVAVDALIFHTYDCKTCRCSIRRTLSEIIRKQFNDIE
jgi:hypothetical protein